MNRSLLLPAMCCALAYLALLAMLHQAVGREATTFDARETLTSEYAKPSVPHLSDPKLLSLKDAKRLLTTLSGEYLRPWRKWETSPHRLYSRAMPRPIPSISAEVAMSPNASGEGGSFLLATIVVRTGKQSQSVPCVVDRTSKQVRLFSDGQWLTQAEWLKQAPLPERGA